MKTQMKSARRNLIRLLFCLIVVSIHQFTVSQETLRDAKPCSEGLYPNPDGKGGFNCYPCLGCHPCPSPGHPDDFCDNASGNVVVTSNPNPSVSGVVVTPISSTQKPVKGGYSDSKTKFSQRITIMFGRSRGAYPNHKSCCESGFVCIILRDKRSMAQACPGTFQSQSYEGTATISRYNEQELRINIQPVPRITTEDLSQYIQGKVQQSQTTFPSDLLANLLKGIGLPAPDSEVVISSSAQAYEVIEVSDQRGAFKSKLLISQKANCEIGGKPYLLRILTSADGPALESDNRLPKVKCNCGRYVYGKDKAACERICKFLEENGWLF